MAYATGGKKEKVSLQAINYIQCSSTITATLALFPLRARASLKTRFPFSNFNPERLP